MTLYSKPLGSLNVNDAGVVHTIYTVPSGGGPAIIRSVSIFADAGTNVIAEVQVSGGPSCVIGQVDNSTGTVGLFQHFDLYQPIEPNDSIFVRNVASGGTYTVIAGGYQFTTP